MQVGSQVAGRCSSPQRWGRGQVGPMLSDELRARDVLDQLGTIVLVVAPDGMIIYGNEAALFAYGYSLDELTKLHVSALRDYSDRDAVGGQLQSATEGGACFETVHRRSDGRTFPVEVNSRPLSTGSGTVLISLVTDIAGRRAAMEALRESEERFRLLAENSTDVVMRIVPGGVISWVSPSVTWVLGWPQQDLIGTRIVELVHPEDDVKFSAGRSRIALEGDAVFRYRVRRADGSYCWVESHAKPYVNADGEEEGVIAIVRVVEAQSRAERDLERFARCDELTGLLARQEMLERLQAAAIEAGQAGERMAIILCDVDGLDEVNATQGWAGGDTILRDIAEKIRASVRRSDLVGRVGGDEFLVALLDVQKEANALHVAEQIRTRTAERLETGSDGAAPTLSLGVALTAVNETAESVVARVEVALREAKRKGYGQLILVQPPDGG